MASDATMSLVVDFLESRGLQLASSTLKTELEQSSGNNQTNPNSSELEKILQHACTSSLGQSGEQPQHLLRIAAETTNRPELYEKSYAKLNDWVAKSLERHRAELTSILFPVFVHCYFGLIRHLKPESALDQSNSARRFLHRYGPELQLQYRDEMGALFRISSPEHLESDPYAKQLLAIDPLTGQRPVFRLGFNRISVELLFSFLQSNNLLLVIIILNDFVDIVTEDRDPVSQPQVVSIVPKRNSGAAQSPDLTPVYWGVLPESSRSETRHPFLGVQEDTAPPYPLFNSKCKADIPEKLINNCFLETLPSYPLGNKDTSSSDGVGDMGSADKPSVLFSTFANIQGSVSSASMTKDVSMTAAAFGDQVVRVWHNNVDDVEVIMLRNHAKPVYGLSWSPDQRQLLTAGGDGDVKLYDIKMRGKCLGVFKGHGSPVWDVSFCPLGHYFLSASMDHTARLWAIDQSCPLRIFVGHYSDVTCVKFHPNCAYAITGSCDKTVRMWDLQTGSCVRVLSGHEAPVTCLDVAPSGRYICSGSEDCTCRIWDITTGNQVAVMKGHSGSIHSVDFSVDGSMVATGSADCTVGIWNVLGAFNEATAVAHEFCQMKASSLFQTKNTPVIFVQWTRKNLLLAGGAFDIQ